MKKFWAWLRGKQLTACPTCGNEFELNKSDAEFWPYRFEVDGKLLPVCNKFACEDLAAADEARRKRTKVLAGRYAARSDRRKMELAPLDFTLRAQPYEPPSLNFTDGLLLSSLLRTEHVAVEPPRATVFDMPTGGAFSGAGASGSWEPSTTVSSFDSSSSSCDSGSSSCDSGSSDSGSSSCGGGD